MTTCCSVSPNPASCSGSPGLSPTDALLVSAQHHFCSQFALTKSRKRHRNAMLKTKNNKQTPPGWQSWELLTGKGREGRREGGGATTPRPGGGTRWSHSGAQVWGHGDMQGDPFTSGHARGPKRPSIKTGLKHPTKVSGDKAHRKNTAFSGSAFASEVCLAVPRPLARLRMEPWDGVPKLPELHSTLGKQMIETMSLRVLLFLSILSCHCACHLVILGYLSSLSA